ncbi:MAG: isochorismatase family protein [Chloroflexi bacterium]|nr:isochorismatase family protein [Chloroflexota bacterium]
MADYDARTALIVVDVQNDFADPAGGLYVRGGEEIVPHVNDEIERARGAGALVVYTQDWHPESTPHFEKDGGVWPVHCVRDTWGAELHPALRVEGEVVRKGTDGEDGYSGFTVRDPRSGAPTPTVMESKLRERGVERVVVVGIAADVCVKETALDAVTRGFGTTVLREATRGVDLQPGDTELAFVALAEAGAAVE